MKKKKREKKGFSLRKEYLASWNYINSSRRFIYLSIGIFFFFVLLGFIIPVPEVYAGKIMDFIKQLLEQTQGMSQFELTEFIFLNNIQSSFLSMALGVFFGIFPVLAAIANGFLLGFVAFISVNEGGFLVLWRIFPHGIFELPAIFISMGLGLKLGMFIFQKNQRPFKYYLANSLRVFLFIVIPLLVFAAVIEAGLISLLS